MLWMTDEAIFDMLLFLMFLDSILYDSSKNECIEINFDITFVITTLAFSLLITGSV